MREWYVLTYLFGAVFVSGQVLEYAELTSEGITLSANGYGSVFYITTGFHGLHVIGGLLAFIFVLARSTMGRFTPAQATATIVVSYYWHFVDIVWIGLFATIGSVGRILQRDRTVPRRRVEAPLEPQRLVGKGADQHIMGEVAIRKILGHLETVRRRIN